MPFGLDDAAFGAIVGAGVQGLFSAGGAVASSAMANAGNMATTTHAAKLQNKYNKDYAKWSATELPSLNREGMEKAGFNPILAYSQGTGEQGHVNVSAPNYQAPDFAGVVNSAFRSYLDAKEVASRVELNNAQRVKTNLESMDIPMLNYARLDDLDQRTSVNFWRGHLLKHQYEHPDKFNLHAGPFRMDFGIPSVSSAVDNFYIKAMLPLWRKMFQKESEMSRIENDGNY